MCLLHTDVLIPPELLLATGAFPQSELSIFPADMTESTSQESLSSSFDAMSSAFSSSVFFDTMAPSTSTTVAEFTSSNACSVFDTTSASCSDVESTLKDSVPELSSLDKEAIEKYYIGAMTDIEAEKNVKAGDFRVYYRVPSVDEVCQTVAAPLYVVYNSSEHKLMHFPIVIEEAQDVDGVKMKYRVDCYGREANALTFGSLPALIRICRRHSYYWPKLRKVEQFPIHDL
uniref:Tudor domain-containing protein n=1 Tax=Steinernema glaseri TaxID=37863 RepID=A0A1I7YBZ5_9BILA